MNCELCIVHYARHETWLDQYKFCVQIVSAMLSAMMSMVYGGGKMWTTFVDAPAIWSAHIIIYVFVPSIIIHQNNLRKCLTINITFSNIHIGLLRFVKHTYIFKFFSLISTSAMTRNKKEKMEFVSTDSMPIQCRFKLVNNVFFFSFFLFWFIVSVHRQQN